jgi:hypothetical protein
MRSNHAGDPRPVLGTAKSEGIKSVDMAYEIWYDARMNNAPYNLTEEQLVLDPSSVRMFEVGTTSAKDLVAQLSDWSEDEVMRVLHGLSVLLRSPNCDTWVNYYPHRHLEEYALMALDTAMVWERG